jgi:DNA-binding transcriptional ArsR family regulator
MKLLSDPLRLRLLLAVEQQERSVQDLADAVDRSHQATSHHLNMLFQEGLVTRRQEGTLMMYSLADYSVSRLLSLTGEAVAARLEELGDLVPSGA